MTSNFNFPETLNKIVSGVDLSRNEAETAMNQIMSGNLLTSQIAAFAAALRTKGESEDEIAGLVSAMKKGAVQLPVSFPDAVDTCGTGGDSLNTFNISTVSALVAAGAGVKVAKHGNRSASSKSGSADVLEALGVNLNISPEDEVKALREIGITFIYARSHHPALKHAAAARKEIGIRTVFNLIGPMTNPAGAATQLMGVFPGIALAKVAVALKKSGAKRAMVVRGTDGMDEISLSAPTDVAELLDGEIILYKISPEDFGIETVPVSRLIGGTPEENAKITLDILNNRESDKRNIVLLNAGAVIYLSGIADSIKTGISKARESISSKAALSKLELLVKISNE